MEIIITIRYYYARYASFPTENHTVNRRNSILVTRHYQDLGIASWLAESNFLHGTTNQKQYPDLGSDASSV